MSEFPKDDRGNRDSKPQPTERINDRRGAESEWLRGTTRSNRGDRGDPGGEGAGKAKRPRIASPRTVVCDEGELDSVYDLLLRMDQAPLRIRPRDLAQLKEWEQPSRLFITTVRVALAHPLTLSSSPDAVSIAIADSDAQTLCTAMLRRGFRYVVRRPVHPEALRLLLMQVLYAGREHRVVTRFPFGGEARWRAGWRTGSCVVSEISAHGCRLMTNVRFPLDSVLHLRVPAALASSRELRLRGRVVRREIGESAEGTRVQVGIRFEKLSARSRAHLDAMLAERASGPASLGRNSEAAAALELRTERGGVSRLRLSEGPEPPAAEEIRSGQPQRDRRRRPRGLLHQEVVALDDEKSRVLYTLMGTELSTGGMRVEPHPLLRLGDTLKLALYDAGQADPMVVAARIVYEDGRRGWGLVFDAVTEEVTARLEEMVVSLPLVSSLSEKDEKPEAVVMGEIMSVGAKRTE